MKHLSGRYPVVFGVARVLLLLGTAYIFAMFQGGFVSWFIFYSFLPIALYTIIVAIYPLNDISLSRLIEKDTFHSGETLRVTITINRKLAFPIFYLLVNDELPQYLLNKYQKSNPDFTIKSKGLFSLGFKCKEVFKYDIPKLPRGEFKFDGITLKTGDLFGFLHKEITIPIEQTVVVFPQLQQLSSWRPPAHNEGGHHRSKKSFEYDLTSVSSVRDYIPGDRLSWLDWKATARTTKLVTKQFEYPLNRDVVIILDRTAYRQGYIVDTAFEAGVSLSASLVRQALHTGSSVGFLSIGEELKTFPMNNNSTQQWLVFDHLARTEADGKTDIAIALKKLLNNYGQHPAIAFVTTEISDHLQTTFHEMVYRGLSIEFFLIAKRNNIDDPLRQKINYLEMLGVKVFIINNDAFNKVIKAGVQRATS